MPRVWLLCVGLCLIPWQCAGQQEATRPRVVDIGLRVGSLVRGPLHTITSVPGVRVGHTTIVRGDAVRTGVTVVLPPGTHHFREKVPGAVFVGNGFGKLAGSTQVEELGEIETPIALTSTLNVPRVADALLDYMLALPGNEMVLSINPLVAETNDGYQNDIHGRHVGREEVPQAPAQEQSPLAGRAASALRRERSEISLSACWFKPTSAEICASMECQWGKRSNARIVILATVRA